MNRRTMLALSANAAVGLASTGGLAWADEPNRLLPNPSPAKLPQWRGFNLLEMFMAPNAQRFREEDFALIAELGFNFVRLPLDYRCWIESKDWTKLNEDRLKWIDEAVGFGRKHWVHVQINFHRAPGYTVADPSEAKSVWTDPEALDICAQHWSHFAKRYQGIENREVSFNLFNEPARIAAEPHRRVVSRLVDEIHRIDRDRLIVCDGRDWGTKPPTELIGLGVAAATRGYAPFHLTHYRANWIPGSDKWQTPEYPMIEAGSLWDRSTLKKDQIVPWKELEAKGVGIMVGEFGAFSHTPHPVVIAWMRDCLKTWKEANWGWALWNFRGGFGILDSDRTDVTYENWHGHKLDRAMLNLLRSE